MKSLLAMLIAFTCLPAFAQLDDGTRQPPICTNENGKIAASIDPSTFRCSEGYGLKKAFVQLSPDCSYLQLTLSDPGMQDSGKAGSWDSGFSINNGPKINTGPLMRDFLVKTVTVSDGQYSFYSTNGDSLICRHNQKGSPQDKLERAQAFRERLSESVRSK
jgi:hypothetical protein